MPRTTPAAPLVLLSAVLLLATACRDQGDTSARSHVRADVVVDDDRQQCADAGFTRIQDAVDAAPAGSTILVCAGEYRERLHVGKPMTLLGAQHGKDGRTRALDAADESIVRNPEPISLVQDVVLDGFRVHMEDPDGEGQGLELRSDGNVVRNNVFHPIFTSGIILRTTGDRTTLIERNRFYNRFGVASHNESSAHNVIIQDNLFTNARLFLRSALDLQPSVSNVQVLRNAFVGEPHASPSCTNAVDAVCMPGILLERTQNVLVHQNKMFGGDQPAIALVSNYDLRVIDNNLRDGAGVGMHLREVDDASFPRSSGVRIEGNRFGGYADAAILLDGTSGITIEGNEVDESASGIRLNNAHGNQITANAVEDNVAIGIDLDAQSAGNDISRNEVRGNGELDCRDRSTGGGTAGTANSWTENEGSRSDPASLCVDR